VNNAAVQHLDNAAEHATEAIDTNYFGTINLTEQLLPHLKASPAGARIVNLSSRSGWLMVSFNLTTFTGYIWNGIRTRKDIFSISIDPKKHMIV